MHDGIDPAIDKHEWKVNLIERDNPRWDDRYPKFFIEDGPVAPLQRGEPHL